uniref:Calcium-transporting ATPase 3, plasma membrane-type n=1 Tax=Lygus hesperus TaxID=30085 RepID=A0A0A9XTM7_LYGHE
MPFDRYDMYEDHEVRDLGFSSQYPHVWSAFENRLHLGDGDSSDGAPNNGVLGEQVREVGGYIERMGSVFETETGELAIQFPHIISDFETYRSICVDTLDDEYEDRSKEHEETEMIELEGSVSYASASWNNCEVHRDNFLQLEDERFDDLESLDYTSYKSFDFDDEDSDELPKVTHSSEVTAQKLDSDEDTIMFPEMGGFNEMIKENDDGGDEKPWNGSGRELSKGQPLEQINDVLEKFQDYTTNDVPNRVEKEIHYETVEDVNNVKSADQLPKVMLKWLGHFWGLEDELSPPMENVSKFQHVFTPLKVAATK